MKEDVLVIAGRITNKEVITAIDEYIESQREQHPSYCKNDLVQLAIVKYLKIKGFLDESKRFL